MSPLHWVRGIAPCSKHRTCQPHRTLHNGTHMIESTREIANQTGAADAGAGAPRAVCVRFDVTVRSSGVTLPPERRPSAAALAPAQRAFRDRQYINGGGLGEFRVLEPAIDLTHDVVGHGQHQGIDLVEDLGWQPT